VNPSTEASVAAPAGSESIEDFAGVRFDPAQTTPARPWPVPFQTGSRYPV